MLQRCVICKQRWNKICCCFPCPCLLLDQALRYFLKVKINIKGIRSILEVVILAFLSNSATEKTKMVFSFKAQLLQLERMDQRRSEMTDAYKYHTYICCRQKGTACRLELCLLLMLLTAAAGLAQSGAGKSPPRLLPLQF